jgi:NTE family protein
VARIPILRYNLETVDLLKEYFPQWENEIRAERFRGPQGAAPETKAASGAETCGDLRLYMIEVDFGALSDQKEKTFFQGLPTSFNLPPEAVEKLREAGGRILRKSPEFQGLLRDLPSEKGKAEERK